MSRIKWKLLINFKFEFFILNRVNLESESNFWKLGKRKNDRNNLMEKIIWFWAWIKLKEKY